MSLIALLRHGEVKGGACFRGSTDDPITPQGRSQMWNTINRNPNWQQIISSPMIRCADFAQRLAQRDSIPLRLDERLREIDFGAWEGRTSAALMAEEPEALRQFWKDPVANRPPGGEPLIDFQERVLNAWQETIRNFPCQRILWITHGGVIRIILCKVLKKPIAQLLQTEIRHAAIYQIRISNSGGETGDVELVE